VSTRIPSRLPPALLIVFLLLTAGVYAPGLSGGFLFDDYPNIVDNPAEQPQHLSLRSLAAAALSSPSSQFKRPLSALSFALNDLATGLDPFWMKLTNVVIHLVNGLLFYWLTALLLASLRGTASSATGPPAVGPPNERERLQAALVAGAWMLLPINLTAVLYVVQRMESLANVFVVAGLLGYVVARRRSLRGESGGTWRAALALIAGTVVGFTAKETAVMTPLYALVIEAFVFRFRRGEGGRTPRVDWGVALIFVLLLLLPLILGLIWLLPQVLSASDWDTRNFTLGQRLLSEARVVLDYLRWIVLPPPQALSFYHDNYHASTGWLTPWTTLPSVIGIGLLLALIAFLRQRAPRVALGLALFFACQLLTGTILPLELVYEHRNYFASYGVMLALVPALAGAVGYVQPALRWTLLGALFLLWAGQTALTSYDWGNPLRLARTLAERAPDSPRAEYDLGRTLIIASNYDPHSPYTREAYAPLERAMHLPGSSILPEQALIFFNSRMGLPLKDAWWQAMIDHLRTHPVTVQDESSLDALAHCADDGQCRLPPQRMVDAFLAALSHPPISVRVLVSYADFARGTLHDIALSTRLMHDAVQRSPHTLPYRITYAGLLLAVGDCDRARTQIAYLRAHDIAHIYAPQIATLQQRLAATAASQRPPVDFPARP
jgi:hypothetical protein